MSGFEWNLITDFQLNVSVFQYVERFWFCFCFCFFASVTVAFIVDAVQLFAF